jgi:hypothetical protein
MMDFCDGKLAKLFKFEFEFLVKELTGVIDGVGLVIIF